MDWTYLFTRSCLQSFSQEAKDAIQKCNVEEIEKFKSRTVHETYFASDIHEDSQDMIASSNTEIEEETPKDDLLDFINIQNHTEDQ